MTAPMPPRLSVLLRDRRASVALELALVIPILLLITLGFYEAYSYIRSVSMVERAAANLASMMGRQVEQLKDCAEPSDALNLGTYVDVAQRLVSPLPLATQGEVILSAVYNPGNNIPRVRWQRRSTFKQSGVASVLGVQNAPANLPSGLDALVRTDDSITVMVVEITYRFRPFAMTEKFWSGSPGEVTISRVAYFRPRTIDLLNLVPASGSGCTALPTPPA